MYLLDLSLARIMTFLVLRAQVALSEIQIKAVNHVQAGSSITVQWSRNVTDPTDFSLAKLKHGEDVNSTASKSVPIHTESNKTKGYVDLSFNDTG